MNFHDLLDGAEILSQQGNPSVTGIDYDSRRVQPGFVFVAMEGESTDGNRYIDQAIAKGAVAVVSDSAAEQARDRSRVGAGSAWTASAGTAERELLRASC